MPLDIDAALVEVQSKTASQIEKETAEKWAGRSIACFILFKKTRQLAWLLQGEDHRHEALEHAAFVKDDGTTLRELRADIERHRGP